MIFQQENKKGFTLIELLVVIAIISLLATLAVTSLNNARKRARDTKRLADLRQIRTALELYYDTYYIYPTTGSYGENVSIPGVCTGSVDCSHSDQDGLGDGDFMEFLATSGIMPIIPDDPISDNGHRYDYFYYTTAWGPIVYGCETPYYFLIGYGFEAGLATGDGSCSSLYVGRNDIYVIIGGQKQPLAKFKFNA